MLQAANSTSRLSVGDRVYLLRVPSVEGRARWRHAIALAGGRRHGQLALLACLKDGVRTLMAGSPPELLEALVAKIERHEVNLRALWDSSTRVGKPDEMVAQSQAVAESAAGLAVIESEVVANYPRMAQMQADEATYWTVAGIAAARLFLDGWEGVPGDFKRDPAGIGEETLQSIPEYDLPSIGLHVESLCNVSAAQRKNSKSEPPTSSGSGTSPTSQTTTSRKTLSRSQSSTSN